MREFQPHLLPERNPVTRKAHQREVLRQITLPLIVGVIVLLAVAILFVVLALRGQDQTVSTWGDISLIWLIMPSLFIALIFLVLLAGLAYGVIKLIEILPRFFLKLQNAIATAGASIKRVNDALVEPIIKIRSFTASLKALRRRL